MSNILKAEDLLEIMNFLKEDKNYDTDRMTLTMEVDCKKTLKKINEEYFYSNEDNKGTDKVPEDTDEVLVTIGGMSFIYKVRTRKDENSET